MKNKDGRWEMDWYDINREKKITLRKYRAPAADGKSITVLAPGLVEAKMMLASIGTVMGWVTSHDQLLAVEQVEFSEQSSRG